ncbi:MAG: cation:proton antiporter subunit C [Gemmatimonadetes bacterium]|jgi:multicomponent Na+:H+ antiporter subunit C|nr:cation:proton antiporter subunit C [Gemmatimonadota bacterium]
MTRVLGLYNYWITILLMMTGFLMVIWRTNFVKKVIGLSLFQTSVYLLYLTMGKVQGGTAPILNGSAVYSHPLPSVLMLTAIVVGISTAAVALAFVVRIREAYGTIDEDELKALDDAE